MFTEFVSVQLTREELHQIHEALLQFATVEDKLREERGLEAIDKRMLLEKSEQLLHLDEQEVLKAERSTDENLWEHAWYTYTEEWAWFRAKSEVESDNAKLETERKLSVQDFEKKVEEKFDQNFEKYVAEIDMLCDGKKIGESRKAIKRTQ